MPDTCARAENEPSRDAAGAHGSRALVGAPEPWFEGAVLREELEYDLDPAQIAQQPLADREAARLILVPADESGFAHRHIRDLHQLVPERALVVLNDTRVRKARLLGVRDPSGGSVELLLLDRIAHVGGAARYEALARPFKKLRAGSRLAFGPPEARVVGEVVERRERGIVVVELHTTAHGDVEAGIEAVGRVPLPPYIRRDADERDAERYQTVFARYEGAAAAPTAGLHITQDLLARLRERVDVVAVTLHVGLGTFAPVEVDDLSTHAMHSERFRLGPDVARAVTSAHHEGRPVIAVGTTVVRVLETCASGFGAVEPAEGETRLLIQPGYEFRVVDGLLTNFHLPRTTLLALVYALGGAKRVREAYGVAQREGYRFASYGDAMLLENARRPFGLAHAAQAVADGSGSGHGGAEGAA